jgi:hypothetical protein
MPLAAPVINTTLSLKRSFNEFPRADVCVQTIVYTRAVPDQPSDIELVVHNCMDGGDEPVTIGAAHFALPGSTRQGHTATARIGRDGELSLAGGITLEDSVRNGRLGSFGRRSLS